MWMKALPAVTMVPCDKASSCLSSKQETRGAIDLLHMEPEAPKSLITKHLWTTLQVCSGLHGLLLSILWDWTVILPTPVTCSPQTVPKGHHGKISNLVHHGQHLHNQLDSLPACSACASTLQMLLPRQHHIQVLTSAVLAAKQYPKCGGAAQPLQNLIISNYNAWQMCNVSTAWHSILAFFRLTEGSKCHQLSSSQGVSISKSNALQLANQPQGSAKREAFYQQEAPVPPTTSWARWGSVGGQVWQRCQSGKEIPPLFPTSIRKLPSFLTPTTLHFIYLWEKILKAGSAINMSAFMQICLIVLPRKPNFKWSPHVLLHSLLWMIPTWRDAEGDPNTHIEETNEFQVLSCCL